MIPTNGSDDIVMVSRSGQAIRFSEDDVRPMGRAAGGVRGMRLRSGDVVVSCDTVRPDADLLIVTAAGYGKRTDLDAFRGQGRGGQGIRGMRTTSQKGEVVAAMMVGEDTDVIVVSSGGVMIRTPVREISKQGRDATGVRVMNVGEDETVAAVAPVLQTDEEDGGPLPEGIAADAVDVVPLADTADAVDAAEAEGEARGPTVGPSANGEAPPPGEGGQ